MWGDTERRILILGLDGAGKTTILYRLQVGDVVTTIPTIGFNVETVTYKKLKFQVWDLGGQASIRPYWRCYYANTDAVIYVVDSQVRVRCALCVVRVRGCGCWCVCVRAGACVCVREWLRVCGRARVLACGRVGVGVGRCHRRRRGCV